MAITGSFLFFSLSYITLKKVAGIFCHRALLLLPLWPNLVVAYNVVIWEIQAYFTVTLDKSVTSVPKTLMIKLIINEGIEKPLEFF